MSRFAPLRRRAAATALLLAAALYLAAPVAARSPPDTQPEVVLADLPKEARDVYMLIGKGGPFRYDRDGIAFGNREKLLPAQSRGYYHEYTVPTPGAKNRGARRIICGGPATTPAACWYTGDHYRSFRRIRE
jgi:ribonuclease T1